MKRLFVLSLVAVLSVGLLSVGAFAQPTPADDQSEDTYVEWTIDAPMQCTLELSTHNGVNLGTLDEIDVDYSARTDASADPEVWGTSNCPYAVSVEVTSVNTPIGTQVLEDFSINFDTQDAPTTNKQNNSSYWGGSWWSFNGVNDPTTFVKAGNNDYASTDTDKWNVDYMYHTDYDDQNADYRVNLEYTASTE